MQILCAFTPAALPSTSPPAPLFRTDFLALSTYVKLGILKDAAGEGGSNSVWESISQALDEPLREEEE